MEIRFPVRKPDFSKALRNIVRDETGKQSLSDKYRQCHEHERCASPKSENRLALFLLHTWLAVFDNMQHPEQGDTLMTKTREQTCPLCGSPYRENTPLQTSGDVWASIFGVLNKTVTAVSCVHCGYTEMYKRQSPQQKDAFAFSVN